MNAPFEWFPEELSVWRTPEKLTISEWSEKYRVLTEPAEEKGPLRLIRTPYLRPIMDAFLDPEVETIVLCKSVQIAGTEGMLSVVGYFAHLEACPIMVVLADEDTAIVRAWARDYTSWLVHYGQLSTWDKVEELLFRTAYPIVGINESMRIWRAGIDTGGGEREGGMSSTEETYWWIRKNGIGRGCRVWGIKGSSSPLRGKVHLGNVLDKTWKPYLAKQAIRSWQ